MSYKLVIPETGYQSAIIVDEESNESILAIDEREVDGKRYKTPSFADPKMAQEVLDFLNTRQANS